MQALLTLERWNKHKGLVERRVQPCRSFTKGLIEFLYTIVSQQTTLITLADIDKCSIQYMSSGSTGPGFFGYTGGGRIVSPGGSGWDVSVPGYDDAYFGIPGADLGIQIGNLNTAVTPTDRRMSRRIGHGNGVADGGSVLYESYDVLDDSATAIYGTSAAAQMFIPQRDHRLDNIGVKIYKTGAPPADLIIELRPISRLGIPINTVLATGTIAAGAVGASPGAFVNCALAVPFDVYRGHPYAICLYMPGGSAANCYNWRFVNGGGQYARGWGYDSTGPKYYINYPNSFYTSVDDITFNFKSSSNAYQNYVSMFREYGISIGEMEYGATLLKAISVVNPNASFDIVRQFTNHSGAAIDVKEVGINMAMPTNLTTYGAAIAMIARDVVAPAVTVADTEILVVTYTPSITV